MASLGNRSRVYCTPSRLSRAAASHSSAVVCRGCGDSEVAGDVDVELDAGAELDDDDDEEEEGEEDEE